ncbi:hypothetical protein [Ralstonia insidiosa]|jgi:hypothetical protein|nr:hypothetical protein [Ralstonia insidiosa]MBA9939340.1 hypothetical protein [Ralstonia insidiosa]MBC9968110.1 hypothetical protein [Ralstonia insidiosa]MBX3904327.1 hypothetical protein [Ralstonia insidiosa]
MNVCELISAFSAAVVAALVLAVVSTPAQGRHFSAHVQCQRVIGADGQERDHWSLTTFRANTLIGRTVGRLYVALAHARFARQERARTIRRLRR